MVSVRANIANGELRLVCVPLNLLDLLDYVSRMDTHYSGCACEYTVQQNMCIYQVVPVQFKHYAMRTWGRGGIAPHLFTSALDAT